MDFSGGSDGKEPANLLAKWETWVRSLGWGGPLGKGMAAHSCILVWRIPRTEEPGGRQSVCSQRVGHSGATNTVTFRYIKAA